MRACVPCAVCAVRGVCRVCVLWGLTVLAGGGGVDGRCAAKEFNLGDLDDMSKFDEFAGEELDSEGENDGAPHAPPSPLLPLFPPSASSE